MTPGADSDTGRPTPGPKRRVTAVVRIAVSGILLILIARVLDVGDVIARLSSLDPRWILAALGLSVAQMVLLAWRWRFTAGRLGIDLPLRRAISEYYLGVFLNQLLPGGVSGDVSRAWRHARTPAPTGSAVRAVILERLTAQVVMTTVAVASVAHLLAWPPLPQIGAVLAVAVGSTIVVRSIVRSAAPESWVGRVWADTRDAGLAPDALPVQLVSSIVAALSYIAFFFMAARAIGVQTEASILLPLIAPVLMTMLVPITVAGWGVREGAAAALWSLVGLTPEDGVAISVAYGVLVLVSTAPGALVLTTILPGDRDRKARHPRA